MPQPDRASKGPDQAPAGGRWMFFNPALKAFSKARQYLNYQRFAKTTAIIAAILSCLIQVAMLAVLLILLVYWSQADTSKDEKHV